MKVVNISEDLNFIEPDYEGISKVILAYVDLYKVANNKEIVDKCLQSTMVSTYMIDFTSQSDITKFKLTKEQIEMLKTQSQKLNKK